MRKIFWISYAIFIAIVFVTACRKDPKVANKPDDFNPTYIKTSDIYPSFFPRVALPKDNPLTVEGVYLGRLLFYDPVLSIDSSISCASCHDQEHAFADPRTFSTGVFGLKTGRNAPPLFNLAYSKNFFWDARQHTLREQLLEPIQSHVEMAMTLPLLEVKLKRIDRYKIWFKKAFNSEPDIFKMALAIEQFELTLVSSKSRFSRFLAGDASQLNVDEVAGFDMFNKLFIPPTQIGGDCFHCHGTQLAQTTSGTTGGLANNGLDTVFKDLGLGGITGKTTDRGIFKTPGLLNIAVTAPYMHDGRFSTLDEVINHYSDNIHFNSPNITASLVHVDPTTQKPVHIYMSATDKVQLKAFLESMTDTAFIHNPAFGNPYK